MLGFLDAMDARTIVAMGLILPVLVTLLLYILRAVFPPLLASHHIDRRCL
ncbi:hypothetical protein [Sphingopyxis sp. BSNA05]|nr:hypothetical protein [Sphingopyxis sp. BSNA05]